MWIYFVLISLLPFVLLCTDQKYENYAYEDLYEFQVTNSSDDYFQFSANFSRQSSNQTSSTFSSDIFVEPANNYQYQEKLLEYSIQQELINRFLRKCTPSEFKTYIGRQNICTTKELVSHVEWWNYDIFWECVESFPDCHEEVVQFAQQFLKGYESGTKRAACWFAGTYQAGLLDTVTQKLKEHNARDQIKEEKRLQKKELLQKQEQLHDQVYNNLVHDVQQLFPIIKIWEANDNERWQKRAAVWNSQQKINFAMHSFNLSSNQQQFCMLHGDQLGMLYGITLQKQLHQELLDCIDNAQPLYTNELFVSSICLACESNRAGFVHKAATLVDFCYAITDGLMYGTGKALSNTCHTILHPFDTACETIKAAYTVMQTFGNVAKIPLELAYYYATDTQQFYTRCEDIGEYNKALYNSAADYLFNTPAPNIIRDATGLITELVLTHQFMQLTTKLCTDIAQKIPAIIKIYVAESAECELVPIGVSGLKIEKAQLFAKEQQANKSIKAMQPVQKVENEVKNIIIAQSMNDFFENTEFGRFLKPYCEKVNLHCQGGACFKIIKKSDNTYLRKGDIFCLDRLHKDHLEVFDQHGNARCVLDLNGMFNSKKTNIMLSQKRTLF